MSRPSVNLQVSLNCPISVKFNEPNSHLPTALFLLNLTSLTLICPLPYFLSVEELGSPYLSLRGSISTPLRHANSTEYKMYLRGRKRTLTTVITCFSQIMR